VLVALTGGQKLGLLLVAGIFIVFALVSALVIPRRRPEYPGSRGLKAFIAATVVLVVAMLGAIVLLAREDEGEAGGHEAAADTQPAETGPAGTETGATTQAGGQQEGGNAEAGARIFAEEGCGGCHALQEAGSSGSVGPDLDDAKPDFQLVVDRVTNGKGVMPAFGDELSAQEIRDVAAYVVQATGGS
jgi:mono/diheme cytochrome c family protein